MKMLGCVLLLTLSSVLWGAPGDGQSSLKNVVSASGKNITAKKGGSGIGGGGLYSSMLQWCDTTGVILQDAKDEAQDYQAYGNDRISAMASYYNGLKSALQNLPTGDSQESEKPITYKALARGLKIAQIIGVPSIIRGDLGEVGSDKKFDEILSFFAFYYDFVQTEVISIDQFFYLPYIYCPSCDLKRIDISLEQQLITYASSQLKNWRTQFIKTKSDLEGFYPTMELSMVLHGLSYLAQETAKDLEHSLFSDGYACQIFELKRLSQKIDFYLVNRGVNNLRDQVQLNSFVLRVDEIITKIKNKSCL